MKVFRPRSAEPAGVSCAIAAVSVAVNIIVIARHAVRIGPPVDAIDSGDLRRARQCGASRSVQQRQRVYVETADRLSHRLAGYMSFADIQSVAQMRIPAQ